jgi:acetyl esterase/lipase
LPDLDLSRRIVYRIEGMPTAIARRRLVYKRDGEAQLMMDVYAPPGTPRGGSPAVCFVHGGPIPREMLAPTEWGVFTSYGELAAASGLVGIVFNHRLYAPTDHEVAQSDVKAALEYVRDHADDLQVDGDRIGVWAFSGGGPLVTWCLREHPPHLRCLVAFYAILDVRHIVPPGTDPERAARALAFSPAAHVGESRARLPIFVARAGLDAAIINDSVDVFVREALAANACLDLSNHPQGHHGFDVVDDDERSREILARAVAFVRTHLSHA